MSKIAIYQVRDNLDNLYLGRTLDYESVEEIMLLLPKYPRFDTLLFRNIHSFGIENFHLTLIETFQTEAEMNRAFEQYNTDQYILMKDRECDYYNSNRTIVSVGKHKTIGEDRRKNICYYLKYSSLSFARIAAVFAVSEDIISDINIGVLYTSAHISYPLRKN